MYTSTPILYRLILCASVSQNFKKCISTLDCFNAASWININNYIKNLCITITYNKL